MLLEIVCTNIESVLAAMQGGADRIELCEALETGGVTPSPDFIQLAKKASTIPLHVLIRPRVGDFVYSAEEFSHMKDSVLFCKEVGVEGVVLGCLLPDGKIDTDKTRELVVLAKPMSVTFHRAFDVATHYLEILDDVISCGCDRLLTSGQASNALLGKERIRELILLSTNKLVVMPGGGVREENVSEIIRFTGSSEIHSSCLNFVPANKISSLNNLKGQVNGNADLVKPIPDPAEIRRLKKIANNSEKGN
jgi:copper homeostasis protein